ncbi:hypothetical protein BDY24DRAFT_123343 [Mrakia frigida]|uniref:uncharacterized protein n=1 Tax=Mrakia frigida TaxID=29902 RepID=UPI003FCC1E34
MTSTSASSSSNKRPRTSSTSPEPPNSKPRQAHYVSQFFNKTDDSTLLLESFEGAHFAVQRIHLSVASTVFRDTLLIGSDDSSHHIDGLPVLKLLEPSSTLLSLLPFLQLSPVVPLPWIENVAELDTLLQACDKYDAVHTGRTIFNHVFPRLLTWIRDPEDDEDHHLQDLFALSVITHSRFDTGSDYVEEAIRLMGTQGVLDEAIDLPVQHHSMEGDKLDSARIGWRPYNIFDISPSFYERMERKHLEDFTRLRERVLTESLYSWKRAADDFVL